MTALRSPETNQEKNQNKALLSPLEMGGMQLRNRVFMAPLTRARSTAKENTQTPLHALYYAQRAGAGLIISEATQISPQGQGYAWTPGIFTDEQIESWQLVNDAVHNAGGHIFCQLWHVGAISHPVFQPDNKAPVSSSAWTPKGEAFVGDLLEDGPTVPHIEATALDIDGIEAIKKDYRHAAQCAKEAGFDGVELHSANGYLLDQFLRSSVNKRDDHYGGSLENRMRLTLEVVDILCDIFPANRVGVRLSPTGGPGASYDDAPETLYPAVAEALSGKGLAYLHVVRPNNYTSRGAKTDNADHILHEMKDNFGGLFIANGQFEPEEANEWIEKGHADAVAFGRLFISNPDLPARIAQDGPYNEADGDSFYGGGKEGYVDYPTLIKTNDSLK